MSHAEKLMMGIGLLASGTYLIRFAGVKLGHRFSVSQQTQILLADAATVLLLAVAATSTLFESQHFAGMARVLGVTFATFLAWRKAPLITIILGAALMTALLRYAGLP